MAIQDRQFVRILIEQEQRGVKIFNTFWYENQTNNYAAPITDVINAFWAAVGTAFHNVLNTHLTVVALTAYSYHFDFGAQDTIVVNSTGTITGDDLPPYVSARIVKVPNNNDLAGVDTTPFRRGRVQIAGQSEGNQAGGILTSGYVDLLDTLATALLGFTVDSTDFSWIILRPPDENSFPYAAARATISGAFGHGYTGSQNTRKS